MDGGPWGRYGAMFLSRHKLHCYVQRCSHWRFLGFASLFQSELCARRARCQDADVINTLKSFKYVEVNLHVVRGADACHESLRALPALNLILQLEAQIGPHSSNLAMKTQYNIGFLKKINFGSDPQCSTLPL